MDSKGTTPRKALIALLADKGLEARVFDLFLSSIEIDHLVVLEMSIVNEGLVTEGASEVLFSLCIHCALAATPVDLSLMCRDGEGTAGGLVV